MRNFTKNKKRPWILWIFLVTVIVLVGQSLVGEFSRWQAFKKEQARYEASLAEAEREVAELESALQKTEDPRHIEREARRLLNLTREGEEVFVVVGAEDIAAEEDFTAQAVPSVEPHHPIWLNVRSWWEYFFK